MNVGRLTEAAGCVIASVILLTSCSSPAETALTQSTNFDTTRSDVGPRLSSSAVSSQNAEATLPTVDFPAGGTQYPNELRRNAGTVYLGCPSELASYANKGLNVIAFNPKTGDRADVDYIMSGSGLELNAVGCALTGSSDNLRLVIIANTTKPADGLQGQQDKTTGYMYDMDSPARPALTKDLALLDGAEIYGTSAGAVIVHDGGTEVLSNEDLSVLWTDPEQAQYVADEAIVLPRYNTPHGDATTDRDGIEIKSPTGETIYREASSNAANFSNPHYNANGEGVLISGKEQLIPLNRTVWEGRNAYTVLDIVDVNSRKPIDTALYTKNPSHLAFSEGRLFSWDNDQTMQVANLTTGKVEFSRTAEQVSTLHLEASWFFANHLYFVQQPQGNEPYVLSLFGLPSEEPMARTWVNRPVMKLDGWTLVLKAIQHGTNGAAEWNMEDCRTGINTVDCDGMMVKDASGKYPGPWV